MKKSVVFLIHIVFWIIIFGFLFASRFMNNYLYSPSNLLSTKLYKILPYVFDGTPLYFYIGYFGIAKLIRNKRLAISIALVIAILFFILFLVSKNVLAFGELAFSQIFLWGTIGCLFSIFIDWFKKRDKILMLEKQNFESNLALLRNQINPHFLFNTLHNIDALIMDNQEKASKALIKLSDIMRYMLQETLLNHVSLKKELDYIENYISLERLRIKNPEFVKFSINGDYEAIIVAPMLFLPFIENAFKHSVDSDLENGVIIIFNINKNIITFSCDNKYNKADSEKDNTHGIGLETVKKRLELIYPGKHKLKINKNDSSFNVELKIDVNEN
jgi:two-component system, LytTR family, sensor kinase